MGTLNVSLGRHILSPLRNVHVKGMEWLTDLRIAIALANTYSATNEQNRTFLVLSLLKFYSFDFAILFPS